MAWRRSRVRAPLAPLESVLREDPWIESHGRSAGPRRCAARLPGWRFGGPGSSGTWMLSIRGWVGRITRPCAGVRGGGRARSHPSELRVEPHARSRAKGTPEQVKPYARSRRTHTGPGQAAPPIAPNAHRTRSGRTPDRAEPHTGPRTTGPGQKRTAGRPEPHTPLGRHGSNLSADDA